MIFGLTLFKFVWHPEEGPGVGSVEILEDVEELDESPEVEDSLEPEDGFVSLGVGVYVSVYSGIYGSIGGGGGAKEWKVVEVGVEESEIIGVGVEEWEVVGVNVEEWEVVGVGAEEWALVGAGGGVEECEFVAVDFFKTSHRLIRCLGPDFREITGLIGATDWSVVVLGVLDVKEWTGGWEEAVGHLTNFGESAGCNRTLELPRRCGCDCPRNGCCFITVGCAVDDCVTPFGNLVGVDPTPVGNLDGVDFKPSLTILTNWIKLW